jgi:hypothetical protein
MFVLVVPAVRCAPPCSSWWGRKPPSSPRRFFSAVEFVLRCRCCVLPQGSTTAFVGVDECSTIEYFSSDSQIVCLTPRHDGDADIPVS